MSTGITIDTYEIPPGSSTEGLTATDQGSGDSVDFQDDFFDGTYGDGWRLDNVMSEASAEAIFAGIRHELRVIDVVDLGAFRDPATGRIVLPQHEALVQPVFQRLDVEAAAAKALEAMGKGLI